MRRLLFSVKVCSHFRYSSILTIDLLDDFTGTGSQEKNQAFRAIRRALWECKHVAIGIFTDTNSSVANLVPSKEHDPSVCNIFMRFVFSFKYSSDTVFQTRDTNRDLHKPFIYIATMDCLR